ncbi:p-cumate dioxygenase, partial [Micromonospora fluostatini]
MPAGVPEPDGPLLRSVPGHEQGGPGDHRRASRPRVLAAVGPADARRRRSPRPRAPRRDARGRDARGAAMTAGLTVDEAAQVRLWHRVSQFLFREARLLDEWRLREWYDEMLTDDVRYSVPATDVRGGTADALGLIDDDAARLRQRIEQLLN